MSTNPIISNLLKRKWVIIAVVVVAALGFFMAGGPDEDTNANATATTKLRTIRVKTMTVVPVHLDDILTLPGETEAQHDVTVAAESSGRVEWIGPEEGATVTENEAFARIDMDNAQSDLSKARSSYNLAKKQADRRAKLLDQQVLSKEEMDQANTDLDAARSSLAQARKALTQGDVISPVAGIINDLFVDEGEWVNTGQPVAEIVDVTSIKININVPEMDVRYLEKGQMVYVKVDAYPEMSWQGMVDFVAFKAEKTTKTFRVRVVVDNAEMKIRPGMLARVSMQRQSIDGAITAPLHTILDKGGERFLYVAENGIARARNIKIGIISGDRIQILEGLEAGDKLIVSGHKEVEEGVAIEIAGETPNEAAGQAKDKE